MKILFTRFPLESALGGAEIQTISLMEELRKRGHTVEFLGSCQTLLRLCHERGFPAWELRIGPPPVTKWGVVSFLWRRRSVRKVLAEALESFGDLHALVMLSMTEKLLLTSAATEKKLRVLWVEHDRIGRWLKRNPWLRLLRARSKRVTTVVVSDLSRTLYVKKLKWDPAKTVTIPNGIDLDRFAHVKPHRAGRRLHLGCVARLSKEKGVDVLIEAITDLPTMTLDIVGTGPLEKEWQVLSSTRGNRERIRFFREMHLDDFYGTIDALVLPSRDHDPFGLVAAEAMSIGIPVIVTDACGIAGSMRDGVHGRVVKAGSSEAMRTALLSLQHTDKRHAWAKAGQKLVRERFTLKAMVDAYESLLRKDATKKLRTLRHTS